MSEISKYVGQRVRKTRKARGLTIEELSKMINKSKATVSKYENGSIAMDIETLLDIAKALDIDVQMLINFKMPKVKSMPLPQDSFFNQSTYYVYFYDGRIKGLTRSQLDLRVNPDDLDYIIATMHIGISDFNDIENCQHIFEGKLRSYDTITHINLTNQINNTEKLYMCILNPMHAHSPAVGIMSGLATKPFFAPMSFKVLVSKSILAEDEALFRAVELNKEDVKNFRHYNMMLVNRPGSLYLNDK